MNESSVSCPFPVIIFGWVCCCTRPERMTENGQLTRGEFIINDSLRNPHFRCQKELRKLTGEISVISTYACAPEI